MRKVVFILLVLVGCDSPLNDPPESPWQDVLEEWNDKGVSDNYGVAHDCSQLRNREDCLTYRACGWRVINLASGSQIVECFGTYFAPDCSKPNGCEWIAESPAPTRTPFAKWSVK
jgi:hypothetical protein